LEQFKDLLRKWNTETNPVFKRAHIHITGGEPFIRQDFLNLLEAVSADGELFSFAVLTNGSLIDAPLAGRLRELGAYAVQVSIEGMKERNDRIRGAGAFDKTVSALRHLVQEGVSSVISFTAQRDNFREFDEVARLGRELGVTRVWSDRFIPWGNGSALREQVLSPEETRELFEIMHRAHSEAMRGFCKTEISMYRGLQFLIGGGVPYRCGAGYTLVTVQPNGDVYPCRRMPIKVGNLMETPLAELYYESELFRSLRDRDRISEGCEQCSFSRKCRGGLKCLSYAMTGDPFKADPGCWRANREQSRSDVEKALATET